MSIEPVDDLREVVAPLVEDQGLVLDSLRIVPDGASRILDVVVDLPGDEPVSPDIDVIASVSRAISAALDAHDALSGASSYTLQVGTPGAERDLRDPRDFKRARSRKVALRTRAGEEIEGRLLAVDEDGALELEINRKGRMSRRQLRIADVESGRVLLDFRPRKDEED